MKLLELNKKNNHQFPHIGLLGKMVSALSALATDCRQILDLKQKSAIGKTKHMRLSSNELEMTSLLWF